jgi:excisionase family DNA binding protein
MRRTATVSNHEGTLWLKVPDAAARLGLGKTKLREFIDRGDLEVVRVGRAVRVPARALEAFAARMEDCAQRDKVS